MAGLPFLVVFGLVAWVAIRRGWGTVAMLAMFCFGGVAASTAVGATIIGGAQSLLATIWAGVVQLANTAAG